MLSAGQWGLRKAPEDVLKWCPEGGSRFARQEGVTVTLLMGQNSTVLEVWLLGWDRGRPRPAGQAWNKVPSGSALAHRLSVPTGRRGAGGASKQGGAPGAQRHSPEGGEARPKAQAPPGECPILHKAHTRAWPLDSSDVRSAEAWGPRTSCSACLDSSFCEASSNLKSRFLH